MNLNQFSLSSQKYNQHALLIRIFSLIYYMVELNKIEFQLYLIA